MSMDTEGDWLKTELKKQDNVKNRLRKTYENYMQNRCGQSLFCSLSSDKISIDKVSLFYCKNNYDNRI